MARGHFIMFSLLKEPPRVHSVMLYLNGSIQESSRVCVCLCVLNTVKQLLNNKLQRHQIATQHSFFWVLPAYETNGLLQEISLKADT